MALGKPLDKCRPGFGRFRRRGEEERCTWLGSDGQRCLCDFHEQEGGQQEERSEFSHLEAIGCQESGERERERGKVYNRGLEGGKQAQDWTGVTTRNFGELEGRRFRQRAARSRRTEISEVNAESCEESVYITV